ncbi:MAG: exosortase O [Candidatus Brachytrichaceae bacterium NZ_4S206]|jgi:exosortase O
MGTQQPSVVRALTLPANWLQLAMNAAVLCLWLWLFRSTFAYLSVVFVREDFRTNQILLLGILALVAIKLRRDGVRPRLDAAPHPHPAALTLTALGVTGYFIAERVLDVNILAASLFGLASYGLLGLWLAPGIWRAGLPVALLLISALPFGDFVDVFIGYPMRIATAAIVRDGLAAAGVASMGLETILVFENGVSQVDLPCSGVKSLWTGALFLLAATWIEGRRLGLRWIAAALGFAALLFIANTMRVAALVISGEVFGLRLLAEMLHVPLGVLAFIIACTAGVGLLRFVPLNALLDEPDAKHEPRRAYWLAPTLIAGLFALNLLGIFTNHPPAESPGSSTSPTPWTLPAELHTQPAPLKPGELAWLFEDGAERVERLRFTWRGHTGSLLLVTSTHWRAHHKPERCFENSGLGVQSEATHLVAGHAPVRVLSLTDQSAGSHLSAAYWFQSATRITDDYTARLWAALSPQPERWLMVSVLFDEAIDPRSADAEALYLALQSTVRSHLRV